MISAPRGKDDLSLYRGIPSPLALAPWGFGQLLPAVSFSSCEFCNEQRNVLSVSLHPFIFRKRHRSTRYTQFAMILAGVLLGQIPCPHAPFGANTATKTLLSLTRAFFYPTMQGEPSLCRWNPARRTGKPSRSSPEQSWCSPTCSRRSISS